MTIDKYVKKQGAVPMEMTKKKGHVYNRTLLEIWHDKGWLELKGSRYDSADRLRFGLKFILDYNIIRRANLHSGYAFNDKVDSSVKVESEAWLDAQNRYRHAVRSVPVEFWPAVRSICLEEREPEAPQGNSERQKTYFYLLCRHDLCRGLDRIIEVYTLKLK